MANNEMRRFEMLLQLIADELYMARIDRDHVKTSSSDWLTGGGRDLWEKRIESLREQIDGEDTGEGLDVWKTLGSK